MKTLIILAGTLFMANQAFSQTVLTGTYSKSKKSNSDTQPKKEINQEIDKKLCAWRDSVRSADNTLTQKIMRQQFLTGRDSADLINLTLLNKECSDQGFGRIPCSK